MVMDMDQEKSSIIEEYIRGRRRAIREATAIFYYGGMGDTHARFRIRRRAAVGGRDEKRR